MYRTVNAAIRNSSIRLAGVTEEYKRAVRIRCHGLLLCFDMSSWKISRQSAKIFMRPKLTIPVVIKDVVNADTFLSMISPSKS